VKDVIYCCFTCYNAVYVALLLHNRLYFNLLRDVLRLFSDLLAQVMHVCLHSACSVLPTHSGGRSEARMACPGARRVCPSARAEIHGLRNPISDSREEGPRLGKGVRG